MARGHSAKYAAAVQAGERLRAVTTAVMDSMRVDALVYPTMNVQHSINPDAQRGSTCGLSAQSGLPAITVPAGFTPAGLPMGVELLGRAFDDVRLVALAYAYEQGVGNRRAPAGTPPLVAGHAQPPTSWSVTATGPGPDRADASFTFDPVRGTLEWDVAVSGVPAGEIHAIALRRKDAEGRLSVVLRLSGPGVFRASGDELLTPNLRAWLESGALTLEIFTRAHPFGSARAALLATAGAGP